MNCEVFRRTYEEVPTVGASLSLVNAMLEHLEECPLCTKFHEERVKTEMSPEQIDKVYCLLRGLETESN